MSFSIRCLIVLLFLNSFIIHGQNPIAYYKCNGDAKDASGNNNNGKLVGGVTATPDRHGNPCGALLFNGLDGYIEVPNSSSLQSITNKFSVTCWAKIELSASNSNLKWLTLVCKGDSLKETATNPQYRVQILQANSQSTISINTDFTEYDRNFKSHEFEIGKWNFYTLVYNGAAIQVYLNANKIWEFAYSKPLSKNSSPLFIGRDIPGALEYYSGAFDDMQLYNTALSEKEILKLYQDNSSTNYKTELSLKCPSDILVDADKDVCFSTVTFPEPIFSINCGTALLKQIRGEVSGSQFPIGKNLIEYKVESETGTRKTCSFNIIVSDKQPPIINNLPDTIIYVEANKKKVNINFYVPAASDNCLLDKVELVSGIKSGKEFPLGTTTNTFKAIDIYGNSSTSIYNITVKAKIEPQIDTTKKTTPLIVLKKDSVKITSPLITLKQDTTKKKDFYANIYHEYKGVKFNQTEITAVIYDDEAEDGDIVSVYFNDRTIVDKKMIQLRHSGAIYKLLTLDPQKYNSIMIKAWNEGSIPPNTLKIDFYYGNFIENPELLKNQKIIHSKIFHNKVGALNELVLKFKKQ